MSLLNKFRKWWHLRFHRGWVRKEDHRYAMDAAQSEIEMWTSKYNYAKKAWGASAANSRKHRDNLLRIQEVTKPLPVGFPTFGYAGPVYPIDQVRAVRAICDEALKTNNDTAIY